MTYLVLGFLCVMTTVAASAWEDGDPPREPHCHSRFDYEYKVIKHLVRLEETQTNLNEKLKAKEDELKDLKNQIRRLNRTQDVAENQLSTAKGPVVAFTAYIDSTRSLSTRTVFNKLLLNEADAYDESTGVFTCPRTGIYMFSFVGAVRGSGTIWAQLKVNGDVRLDAVSEGSKSDQDLQGSNLAIIKLNAGDTVWVSGSGSLPGNSHGNPHSRTSSFSGVLLYPTSN